MGPTAQRARNVGTGREVSLLGEMFGMDDIDRNLVSYWSLEVLYEVLNKSQQKNMKTINQKMSMIWIIYILKIIVERQYKRREMFHYLKIMFLEGEKKILEELSIPNPFELELNLEEGAEEFAEEELSSFESNDIWAEDSSEVFEGDFSWENTDNQTEKTLEGETSKNSSEKYSSHETSSKSSMANSSESKSSVKERYQLPDEVLDLEEEEVEQLQYYTDKVLKLRKVNVREYHQLIHMIYEIFANRFKYAVIWEAFTDPPMFKRVTIAERIMTPKKVISVSDKEYKTPSEDDSEEDIENIWLELSKRKQEKIMMSKYIRPLSEAVDQRFFDSITDYESKKQKDVDQSVMRFQEIVSEFSEEFETTS